MCGGLAGAGFRFTDRETSVTGGSILVSRRNAQVRLET